MTHGRTAADHELDRVRALVDDRLGAFFDEKRAEFIAISPDSVELVDEVRALTLRGGKRLRPLVLYGAMRAVGGDPARAGVADAGAALELLQTYLLAHDDWMDGDLERRGGPAVHAAFRARHRAEHLADCLGLLAGDLASTYAWELLLGVPFPAGQRDAALETFRRLQVEVYAGQHLDLTMNTDVVRMHRLKTTSYTVLGPAQLGACLGGASDAQRAALAAWAEPIGEAFQVRDDLLGTFGDAASTGKPGEDLRHGKRTALIAELHRSAGPRDRAAVERVLGRADATEAEVADALRALVDSGVRARIEARVEARFQAAARALAEAPFDAPGRALLERLGVLLARRGR